MLAAVGQGEFTGEPRSMAIRNGPVAGRPASRASTGHHDDESIGDPAPSARRGRPAEAGISRGLAKCWRGKTRLRPDVLDIFP